MAAIKNKAIFQYVPLLHYLLQIQMYVQQKT